jgi:very-short-patch-repair endonuclease
MTGGRWLGLERVPEPPRPQLVVPSNRHPRDVRGLDVVRVVPARWKVQWNRGLPVTPTALTIRDMGPYLSHEELRDIAQHALRRRRTTCDDLTKMLGRGRPGAAPLRAVIEEIGPGYQVKYERTLHLALRQRGIDMKPQTKVEASDGRVAYLDLGIEELRFGVEIDGFLNHMARFQADRRRARMLALELGWTIAPVAVDEIVDSLDPVVDEIVRHVLRLRAAAA